MHRIALAVSRVAAGGRQNVEDASGASAPRSYLFDRAFSPVWDESILDRANSPQLAPRWWQLARAVRSHQAEYDGIVTWGEKLSLAMLLQQQFTGAGKPHIAMMYQFEKPNIRVPLSVLKKRLHAVITWNTVQRRALIERIGFPRERVYLVRHYVDQLFYRPVQPEGSMICAVGAEMRDYPTLLAAMRGTGIHCHIATDHVRIPGRMRALADRRVPINQITSATSEHVTVGRMTLPELRELYARSRFVVIPLLPSDTDNGITVMLEAMAMGKPVICSRTRGQVDVLQDGVTGLFVPVGDAHALREAILGLWNDPARTQLMGRNARAFVERHHTLEQFTAATRAAAEAAVVGQPAPDSWWE
jgi:glycosyltransferase involved in cell wall biosynthesis